MLYWKRKKGYPILDGNVVVKVNLKNKSKESVLSEIIKKVRHYIVNQQMKGYFYNKNEDVPVVNLIGESEELEIENLELNLNKDEMPPMARFKWAAGFLLTAGLVISALLSGGKISNLVGQKVNSQAARGISPVLSARSEKETFLCASLLDPTKFGSSMRDHRFIKSGHANVGSHTNYTTHLNSGGGGHQNVVPSHQNASEHQNWYNSGGHGNLHTNTVYPHQNNIPHQNANP